MNALQFLIAAFVVCLAGNVTHAQPAPSRATVLLISMDGLKPEAVLDAQAHGLQLPHLRAMMRDGSYARDVLGVLPTLTYPGHTTILTGASPAHHGISASTTFDPLNHNQIGWYWYSEDIRVPTLRDAAHSARIPTANVCWPVSVGERAIDFNLPQIWRAGTADDLKLQRALATPGLEPELVSALGRYPGGEEESVADDEIRTKFAVRILETKHPGFMTMYLTGLDTEQHASGPFSAKSNAVLERLDALVGTLRDAAENAAPGHTVVCVISDHGFAKVDHDVNLYTAFLGAGLLTLKPDHTTADWTATVWPAGGAAAIMLKDPHEEATRAKSPPCSRNSPPIPPTASTASSPSPRSRTRAAFPTPPFSSPSASGTKSATSSPRRSSPAPPTWACTATSAPTRRCIPLSFSSAPASPPDATSARSTCAASPPRSPASSAFTLSGAELPALRLP